MEKRSSILRTSFWGIFAVTLLIVSIVLTSNIAVAGDQESYRMFYGYFRHYREGDYSSAFYVVVWRQTEHGLSGVKYSIQGDYYILDAKNYDYSAAGRNGGWMKSVLDIGYTGGYAGARTYYGPNNYNFYVFMVIESREGGVIFRYDWEGVNKNKYYLATIIKPTRKLQLYYVDESKPPGTGLLTQADIPSSIDLDDEVELYIKIVDYRVTVRVSSVTLIENYEIDSAHRIPSGGIGLYTYKGGEAKFRFINWMTYYEAPTTVTTTKTITNTETLISTTTITTTATQVGGTVTVTETSTTTLPAETITQTKTVTETELSTVTSTVTETKGLGCLIATAAFGSELAPQVQLLRGFRDGFVLKTFAGSSFMAAFNAFYYSWSPYVAKAEYENPMLRSLIRASIYPLIYSLELSRIAAQPLSMAPELAVLVSGIIASLLIGLIYISPIAIALILIARRKGWRMPRFKITYLFAALFGSLAAFALAEITSSVSLMMLASALTVLSFIALGASLPALAIGYASAVKAFRQNRET